MKRIILIALIIVSIFTFGACGKADAKNVESEPSASSVVVMEQEVSSEVESVVAGFKATEEQEPAEIIPEELFSDMAISEVEWYLAGSYSTSLEKCIEDLRTIEDCMSDNEQFIMDIEVVIFSLEHKEYIIHLLDGEISYEEYITYLLEEIELKDYTLIK